MGTDSGVRRKHKQRTAIHKKHAVYPGMKLTNEVMAVSGSIKRINTVPFKYVKENPAKIDSKEPKELWEKYDKIVKDLPKNGSSAALQIRRHLEFQYYLAYRALVKVGQLNKIKRKYNE